MKFSKSGRIVLALLVSLIASFGITSCSSNFTVGYLYVTGTSTENTTAGQVSGFKIANNTGALTPVAKSPFSSGGENPRRALVLQSGRFLYVLNAGDPNTGTGSGISLFFVGGAGTLNFQSTYNSQGSQPLTIVSDTSGAHLFVLDEFGPANSSASVAAPTPCIDSAGVAHPVGEITVFNIDQNTGRLILVKNNQQSDSSGTQLNYFPVGCFPIDSAVSSNFLYTIQRGTRVTNDLQSVFVYGAASTGQLTLTSSSTLATNAFNLTSIFADNSGDVYLLDAGQDPTNPTNLSFILPYVGGGTGGALATAPGGVVSNDPNVQNPVALLVEAKTHSFLYLANAGPDNSTTGTTANSSISAFARVSGHLNIFTGKEEPFPTGASPRCIVEDPTNQYIYTANHDSSTVTGLSLDTVHGTLVPLIHDSNHSSFPTSGNPTWCVVDGSTE